MAKVQFYTHVTCPVGLYMTLDQAKTHPKNATSEVDFGVYNLYRFRQNPFLPHSVTCIHHKEATVCCGNSFQYM